jgi:hypothetical protein
LPTKNEYTSKAGLSDANAAAVAAAWCADINYAFADNVSAMEPAILASRSTTEVI